MLSSEEVRAKVRERIALPNEAANEPQGQRGGGMEVVFKLKSYGGPDEGGPEEVMEVLASQQRRIIELEHTLQMRRERRGDVMTHEPPTNGWSSPEVARAAEDHNRRYRTIMAKPIESFDEYGPLTQSLTTASEDAISEYEKDCARAIKAGAKPLAFTGWEAADRIEHPHRWVTIDAERNVTSPEAKRARQIVEERARRAQGARLNERVSPAVRLHEQIEATRRANPKMSYGDAMTRTFKEEPALVAHYHDEMRGGEATEER